MPGEIRNDNSGRFMAGSPVYSGKINCKCVLFPDCPFFKRKLQDEHFVLSPNTIDKAPSSIREKVESVPGLDGIFLSPQYVYRHNFIAALKESESSDVGEKNKLRDIEKATLITPASQLYFASIAHSSLVMSFFKTFTAPQDGVLKTSFVYPYVTVGAEAAHMTWIDDGSIYINYTFTQAQLDSEAADGLDRFKKRFYPTWGYTLINTAPDASVQNGAVTVEPRGNYKHLPYQSKSSAHGDPITHFLDKLPAAQQGQFKTSNNNVYKNINPGIHWRVLKRTPLFQGEDFWVEFHKKALETDVDIKNGARFQVRKGLEFLDPYQQPQLGANGQTINIINEAIVEIDQSGTKSQNALQTYDLSNQSYIIIELGYLTPNDNYFIIIAERDKPIFCHAGRPVIRNGDKVEVTKNTVLRRLSRYDAVLSSELLKQDKLRITFRQHLGKMVINFSEHDDRPWVISRQDLLPLPDAPIDDENYNDAANFDYEDVPIIIPNAKMAIMGGNLKTAFTFSPMQYRPLGTSFLDQKLHIAGPVKFKDVNLLLRDKGLSRDPNVSTKPRDFEFSQDAEVYQEMVEGKPLQTRAIKTQEGLIRRYGKAPDMQELPDSNDRHRSRIAVGAVDLSARQGSTPVTDQEDDDSVTPIAISTWIEMRPGDYIFTQGLISDGGDPWFLYDCITPIMTGFRLNVPPKGEAFDSPAIDVSHHVMSITDTWNEDCLAKINHNGRIQFLVNRGMNGVFADGKTNYAEYLRSLADRHFYIQISVWWDEDGAMPTPNTDAGRIIFTGICSNVSISEETNKHIMTGELFDYTKVLQEQVFLNSPFFDKMRDFNAVYEIIQKASFRDGSVVEKDEAGVVQDNPNTQPGSLMRRLAETDVSGWFQLPHNGETVYNQEYALPGSYSILTEPMFRFQDGSTLYEAVQKLGEIAGKVIYFDRQGVFHYEKLPYDQALFNGQQGSSNNFNIQDWQSLSKMDFFVSPHDVSTFDGKEQHRMAWDSYTVTRDMDSVINHINVISNTPDGKRLQGGLLNIDSINDIEKPGFIGYPKTLLQIEGIIGDKANVQWLIKHYTKLFLPPVKISFKAIGHNGLKALDIITFTGLGWSDKQVLIIGSISSEINAETNQWWQEFECYWIFPSVNLNPSDINVNPIDPVDLINQ